MQCAICGAEAEDITPAGFDGIGVRCKSCGDYEVTSVALNGILRLEFEARQERLALARQAVDACARPRISSTS